MIERLEILGCGAEDGRFKSSTDQPLTEKFSPAVNGYLSLTIEG